MRQWTCQKCGLDARESSRGIIFGSTKPCPDLKGTKYYNPDAISNPGANWCPSMSDSAPGDLQLLPPAARTAVEAAIAAKGKSS
jgi:ssDNA-binding Zn-finger/Zn-ribbon topoisomerase 1